MADGPCFSRCLGKMLIIVACVVLVQCVLNVWWVDGLSIKKGIGSSEVENSVGLSGDSAEEESKKTKESKKRKDRSGNQDAGKSIEESSETEMSAKARKRLEMNKLVHDPHYGLLRSSFGGKHHLHSRRDLRKFMGMDTSSSKKKSKSKGKRSGSINPKAQKKSSIHNKLTSIFKLFGTSQKDVGKPVTKEKESSSEEHTNELPPDGSELQTIPKETGGPGSETTDLTNFSAAEATGAPLDHVPKQIILWTSWRSGSTFLGDLLASAYNNTFYSYEPLFHFGTNIFDVIDNERTRDAVQLVEDLLSCDARRHREFVKSINDLKFPLLTNKKLYKECTAARKCHDETFFSDVCASSDLHVLKIIRLSLRFASSMLLDPKFKDLKIVYLARDPRPVMRSRHQPVNAPWCSPLHHECYDPPLVCAALSRDVAFVQQLQEEFPDRFFFVRYEDLSTAPMETVEQLWERLGLPLTPQFSDYLLHTTTGRKPKKQVNDVTRDSASHAFAWRSDIAWELVKEVQDACPSVIANFGWRLFSSEQDLRNLSLSAHLP